MGISDNELEQRLAKLRELDSQVRENHEIQEKIDDMTYKKRCEIFHLWFPEIESRRYEQTGFSEHPYVEQE